MNILLSSVGRRSYLVDYFKAALNGCGKVVATNSVADTTGMFSADIAEVIPSASDVDYLESLLEVCRRHRVRLLFSLHDWEAPFISLNRQKFLDVGTTPVVSQPEIINCCLDKYLTTQFAFSIDVKTPATFVTLESALESLSVSAICFPLILKPRWGQGSISLLIAHNEAELKAAYLLVNSQLKGVAGMNLPGYNPNEQVLIQEMIFGQEYGVDIVNDLQGRNVACFIKEKGAMRSGETDSAVTVVNEEIERVAKKIANAAKHIGNMDADFFISDSGVTYLIEMNPRFGGGYPFSHVAGANIPAAIIAWADGREVDPQWLKVKPGVRAYKNIGLQIQ